MRIFLVLLIIGMLTASALTAEQVSLRFHFTPGEQTTYKVSVAGAVLSKVMSQSQPVQVKGELLFTQKTLSVDAQGNGELATAPPSGKLSFTVRGEDLPQAIPTQALAEKISPLGKLLSSKGSEGPAGGFTWLGLPGLQKLLTSLQFPLLPDRAVASGDQWAEKLSLEVGGKNVNVEQKCTLVGFIKVAGRDCAQIRSQATLPIELKTPPNPLGMSETMKGNEKIGRMTLFDQQTGRIVRQETLLTVLIDTEIFIPTEAGKQTIPGQLELHLKVSAEAQP